jgi:hypothetical protein
MKKTALFLRFINKEVSVPDLLQAYSLSEDVPTREAAGKALLDPPNIDGFRKELTDAVTDLINGGIGEEFKAFVNHYMQSSLEEDVSINPSQTGEDISRSARVKDAQAPWVQGMLCYNLCLYIKAYGLEELKVCKICHKFFDHKGKWAVYCSDKCKADKPPVKK